MAERILEVAAAHGIPVREDGDLLDALMILDLNQAIPASLYRAVAVVLAHVYRAGAAGEDEAPMPADAGTTGSAAGRTA
jgi:flagellar biosynthesis protein